MGRSKEEKRLAKKRKAEEELVVETVVVAEVEVKTSPVKEAPVEAAIPEESIETQETKTPGETSANTSGGGATTEENESKGLLAFPNLLPRNSKAGRQAIETGSQKLLKSNFGLPQWLAEPTCVAPHIISPVDTPEFSLSPRMIARCRELGFGQLFAVQTAVIPLLSRNPALQGLYTSGDVCVSAPTGSGKTLAYAIPIVDALLTRTVRRMRALIILPTRELVIQVRETMDSLCHGSDLICVSITGQTSFLEEQRALVNPVGHPLEGGATRADIVIATPGRLMDHLEGTENFTLQHLDFLVVDEADRLLHQSYHGWLQTLLNHLKPTPTASLGEIPSLATTPDAVSRLHWDVGLVTGPRGTRTQKLLFSATLTRNPEKIASLHLVAPHYISVREDKEGEGRYSTPASLAESMLVVGLEDKPLAILHLLYGLSQRSVLAFCSTVESASRLATLIEAFRAHHSSSPEQDKYGGEVHHFTSDTAPSTRAHILRQFRNGHVRVLICSDLAARGLDLENAEAVINYDVPASLAGYIHRVGRTARAGRKGSAYTLVASPEARFFKDMMRTGGHYDQIKMLRKVEKDWAPLSPAYACVLASLQGTDGEDGEDTPSSVPSHSRKDLLEHMRRGLRRRLDLRD